MPPPPIPGGFAYTPAAGVILNAGTQTLSVTFTPTDTTDYSYATPSPIVGQQGDPDGDRSQRLPTYNTANPTFTGTITGAVNGDTFTESFATTAILSSPVGTYPITPPPQAPISPTTP